jgi:hypothetical protein
MKKIKVGGKIYTIINKIDMENVIHIGQYLRFLLILEDKKGKMHHIFVRMNYNWVMVNMEGNEIISADNFLSDVVVF